MIVHTVISPAWTRHRLLGPYIRISHPPSDARFCQPFVGISGSLPSVYSVCRPTGSWPKSTTGSGPIPADRFGRVTCCGDAPWLFSSPCRSPLWGRSCGSPTQPPPPAAARRRPTRGAPVTPSSTKQVPSGPRPPAPRPGSCRADRSRPRIRAGADPGRGARRSGPTLDAGPGYPGAGRDRGRAGGRRTRSPPDSGRHRPAAARGGRPTRPRRHRHLPGLGPGPRRPTRRRRGCRTGRHRARRHDPCSCWSASTGACRRCANWPPGTAFCPRPDRGPAPVRVPRGDARPGPAFFTPAEIKAHVDQLASYKINHLHLHLTDDQGWRS